MRRWAWICLCAAACEGKPAVTREERSQSAERVEERLAMVERQIVARGVNDEAVLGAMRRVPRHRFVPGARRAFAYEDRPLSIGEDQTISQPYIVASMTEEAGLGKESKVLEIGTGSGYQAAVLAEITPRVFTIEIRKPLADAAAALLKELGYASVKTRQSDGYFGWPEEAPFDVILVTAAAPHVPPPLVRQLARGGRMVIPVGQAFAVQDLLLVTKDQEGTVRTKSLYTVRFVPLAGAREEKDAD
ncbi:MAG: protein-L-isoaspartate(D-aspartate) O-methyltransferase [Planctomycetaceae bacterium]